MTRKTTQGGNGSRPIPASAGIGLRAAHHAEFLARRPATGWVEVHSENFFAECGRSLDELLCVRRDYPVSLHGVGLSLGSADPLNKAHLASLARLVERVEPGLVSEHLSWSSIGGRFLNDLLPMPYTEAALAHLCVRIGEVQERLGRPILIENVSSYLEYERADMAEWEFLVALARQAGCGILLDVNNVYVSSVNHGFDPRAYLAAIPADLVGEIHLAGHMDTELDGERFLIDSHNALVCPAVWQLYRETLGRLGRVPTLIEWDLDLPPLERLLEEAGRAEACLEDCRALVA